jgi:hypothetical protein
MVRDDDDDDDEDDDFNNEVSLFLLPSICPSVEDVSDDGEVDAAIVFMKVSAKIAIGNTSPHPPMARKVIIY